MLFIQFLTFLRNGFFFRHLFSGCVHQSHVAFLHSFNKVDWLESPNAEGYALAYPICVIAWWASSARILSFCFSLSLEPVQNLSTYNNVHRVILKSGKKSWNITIGMWHRYLTKYFTSQEERSDSETSICLVCSWNHILHLSLATTFESSATPKNKIIFATINDKK